MTNTPTAMERARELLAAAMRITPARLARHIRYHAGGARCSVDSALNAIIAALSAPLSPRPDLAGRVAESIRDLREIASRQSTDGHDTLTCKRAADALQQLQGGEASHQAAIEAAARARDAVSRLCDLHQRMLQHYRKQRPYPPRMQFGIADSDAILDGAIAIERLLALRLPADPPAQPAPVGDVRLRALEAAEEALDLVIFHGQPGEHKIQRQALALVKAALTPPAQRPEIIGTSPELQKRLERMSRDGHPDPVVGIMTDTDLIATIRAAQAKLRGGPPWFIGPVTDCGLALIEDGRDHGLFPFNVEFHEGELIVALVNNATRILELADAGVKAREALEEIAAMAKDEGNLNWGHAQDAIDLAKEALAALPPATGGEHGD